MPSTTGSTASRWLGFAARRNATSWPPGDWCLPVCADVVLHVAGPLGARRVELPFELAEDLRVRLAEDVGEHVQAAPVGHAHDHLGHPGVRRRAAQRVEHRDQRLRAFEAEPLLAQVLRGEEPLERLGRVQHPRTRRFLSSASIGYGRRPRRAAWIQAFWSGSWMCMYSTPMVRAYASRSTPRMSRNGIRSSGSSPRRGRRSGTRGRDPRSRVRSGAMSSSGWVCGSGVRAGRGWRSGARGPGTC